MMGGTNQFDSSRVCTCCITAAAPYVLAYLSRCSVPPKSARVDSAGRLALSKVDEVDEVMDLGHSHLFRFASVYVRLYR